MKKLLTIALCCAAVGSLSAQKVNVDAAKKLSGKQDKIEEARNLINQAIANPETANQAETYFIAGKIEFDPNDKALEKLALDPNYAIDEAAFYSQLLNGYKFYNQALPLDALPNDKGKVAPKYTKKIKETLAKYATKYYDAGAHFYNKKNFYPEAYDAFMAYGQLVNNTDLLGKMAPLVTDSAHAEGYFLAGVCAYSANPHELLKAAQAFAKARELKHPDNKVAIYEVDSWSNLAREDSTLEAEANKKIEEICLDGYAQFGVSQPFFVSKLVDIYVNNSNEQKALDLLNKVIAENPDNAHVYGLLGYLQDRMGNNDASEEAYLKAVSLPGVDFDTQLFAARKLYNIGVEKLNESEPATRKAIREKYMLTAKKIAETAKASDPDNPRMGGIDDVLERIDYLLNPQSNQE